MEKQIKVSKTNKYLTVYHWGGIWGWANFSRKKSNEVVIRNSGNGGRSGEYLHIRVEGNEEYVNNLKLEMDRIEGLINNKEALGYRELVRVVNEVYEKFIGYKVYRG
jgi:hypothetical protein